MAITQVKALDFEEPLTPLVKQLDTLEKAAVKQPSPEAQENVEEARLALLERLEALYADLTAWQTVQVARHPERPHADDFVSATCSEFVEFAGDRLYADDPAIMGGLARLDDRVVMVLGHRKGHDTRENVTRNYGMPHPEGYRKARRLMLQAEKFGVPVVCLLDTPAAQASLPAEERGQAWALGDNLTTLATLQVPIVVAVIGEGGSGGALAIGVGDRLLMFQHAIYSVASPEALRQYRLEGRQARAGGGRGAQAHGPRSASSGRCRPRPQGADWRRTPRPGGGRGHAEKRPRCRA